MATQNPKYTSFTSGADGEAICSHRDLSVCTECRSHPWLVEVFGVHYMLPDEDDRNALLAELAMS